MRVSQGYLEIKVKEISDWLLVNSSNHEQYKQKKQQRDYYVYKLCEMEELGVEIIKI